MTTENDIKAEILNLTGNILMGKASEQEIKDVVKRAGEHNLLSFLQSEFKDLSVNLEKVCCG